MTKLLNQKNKIAVLTSGGDAPGMNAALHTIISIGVKYQYEVYVVKNGYQGLYQDQFQQINPIDLPRILNIAGTFIGTSRFLPFQYEENIRQKCFQNLKKRNINFLIVIGGDGSYRGAQILTNLGIPCIGIPATIDNDINETDITLGFSTAVNTIVTSIEKLRDTSISHRRCTIVEVMGRNKGDLALYGGIATKADLIITPENFVDANTLIAYIQKFYKIKNQHAIIVVTERLFDIYALAKKIEKEIGFETRAQILGYLQRGGNPTAEDLLLAIRMGTYAILCRQKQNMTGGISLKGNQLVCIPFEKIFDHQTKSDTFLLTLAKQTMLF
ncbi:MAG: ATP-dependent 6-phosphofructokinase [Vigna little leaf phytoplasma]|nr:ATP-dependent 6-phosphofructokinase [Vigna little leaf phytoplasma]